MGVLVNLSYIYIKWLRLQFLRAQILQSVLAVCFKSRHHKLVRSEASNISNMVQFVFKDASIIHAT